MRIQSLLRTLLLTCILAGPAVAEDPQKKGVATEPPAHAQVLAAFEKKDDAALAKIAKEDARPWIVADRLCLIGAFDAAAAFSAATAARPGCERLPAYVEARREAGPDKELALAADRATTLIGRRKYRRVIDLASKLPKTLDSVARIRVETHLGHAQRGVTGPASSVATFDRAAAAAKALGWQSGEARALSGKAQSVYFLGEWKEAVKLLRRVLATMEQIEDLPGQASFQMNLGVLYYRRGSFDRAIAYWRSAIKTKRRLGDTVGVARVQLNLGAAFQRLGEYADALHVYSKAMEVIEKDSPADLAGALVNLAVVYGSSGRKQKAIDVLQRARRIANETGIKEDLALVLVNLGSHWTRGDPESIAQAVEAMKEALALNEAIGNRRAMGVALTNLGHALLDGGSPDEAIAQLERALEIQRQLSDRSGTARTLRQLGLAWKAKGDAKKGLDLLEQARREAHRIRDGFATAITLGALAACYMENGAAERALSAAEQGVTLIERQVRGLDQASAATAREPHIDLFHVGVRAAFALDDIPRALRFLEGGRAGALMERLGGSDALKLLGDLPPKQREALEAAEAHERTARRAHEQALRGRDLQAAREAAARLDAALDRVEDEIAAITRLAKRKAKLAAPRPATPEEVQDALEEGEALVVYGIVGNDVGAIVLTADDERMLRVCTVDELNKAQWPLRTRKPGQDLTKRYARARKTLVDPLGLGDDIEQVIISAVGVMAYLPWGALLDRPVCCAPSATTHVHLVAESWAEGEGVLAIGDPDYAGKGEGTRPAMRDGRKLVLLPATRSEVESVGDVVLLGADATVPGFVEALSKRPRWRAVHLACHGFVDPVRPLLSSLALTATPESDGHLDVRRLMRIDVDADLAVLSACETSHGREYAAEGIVGLTRSFMYAGTPRVICSLTKVDDEATGALMKKFYELWNPRPKDGQKREPLSASAALRAAQQWVRKQPKWSDPDYWAPWLLWGLP